METRFFILRMVSMKASVPTSLVFAAWLCISTTSTAFFFMKRAFIL